MAYKVNTITKLSRVNTRRIAIGGTIFYVSNHQANDCSKSQNNDKIEKSFYKVGI
jgi:hypothetical protein